MDIQQLNQDFAIPGSLSFLAGQGDFPLIEISNEQAKALISVYAGHILSFQPVGEPEDLIFVSQQAEYKVGKAIRGGIPLCWPWFGPDPEGLGRSNHGLARNRLWQVLGTETTTSGATRVMLSLEDSSETRAVWDYEFQLAIAITVGQRLEIELISRNTGERAFTLSQALHTYFRVGDIDHVKILGLANCYYFDKVDGGKHKRQAGDVAIAEEVDRIYTDVPAELVIEDASFGRRIRLVSIGSRTAIVWNPWAEGAAKMGDLGDEEFKNMVCVETANAANDTVKVEPNEEYRLSVSYQIERM